MSLRERLVARHSLQSALNAHSVDPCQRVVNQTAERPPELCQFEIEKLAYTTDRTSLRSGLACALTSQAVPWRAPKGLKAHNGRRELRVLLDGEFGNAQGREG